MRLQRMENRALLHKFLMTLLGFFCLVFFLFPIYWTVVVSLKEIVDIFAVPPEIIFKPISSAYKAVFSKANFLKYFTNSVIVAVSTTVLCIAAGVMGAYSYITFNYRGRRAYWIFVIMLRMAPVISLVIPMYLLLQKLRINGTYIGLIFVHTAVLLPFAIWLLLGYIQDVPKDLIEAAHIDGCNYLIILGVIVIPLTLPGISVVSILVFISSWNDYLIANIISNSNTMTLPMLIQNYMGDQTVLWNELAATGFLISLPTLLVAICFQKYIVKGLTFGAVKG